MAISAAAQPIIDELTNAAANATAIATAANASADAQATEDLAGIKTAADALVAAITAASTPAQ